MHLEILVEPRYLPEQSKPIEEVYGFAYAITVSNRGTEAAQLISRHWVISDEDGHVEEIKGLGVVGRQPYLRPGEQFKYTSGAHLRTPSGSMRGSFYFVDEEGTHFAVPVPAFVLDATGQKKSVH